MEKSPIVFYYFDLNGTGSFRKLVEERFRQTGIARTIVFREWNCYSELPGEDGDLFLYDGIALPALASKGILRPVPDSLSSEKVFSGNDDIFPWVMDRGRYWNKLFGLPVMMCSNALFCRKKDYNNVRSIMELDEPVAIPVQSMLMFYFVQAICCNHNIHKSLQVMDHIVDLIGGREYLEESIHTDQDGIDSFNREECRYLLGYTEDMLHLKEDDYMVTFERFSNSRRSGKSYFMADYVSLAKNIPDEKLQDCLTLVKIMTDEQFTYDICTTDGKLQYFLPANKKLFPRLAELDPLYNHLYKELEDGDNSVLRYGRNYYEDFEKNEKLLFRYLYEKAGWKIEGIDLDAAVESLHSEALRAHRDLFRKFFSYSCGRKIHI